MGFRGSRAVRVAMTTPNLFTPGPPSAHSVSLSPAINLPPFRLSFPQSLGLWVYKTQYFLLFLLWYLSLPPFPSSFQPLHLPGNVNFLLSLESKFIPWVENKNKNKKKKSLHGNHGLLHPYDKMINPFFRGLEYSQEGPMFYFFLFFRLNHPFCRWR